MKKITLMFALLVIFINGQQAQNDQVTICHNGNTIQVDNHALQAHLDHGDAMGSCAGDCINPDQICTDCYCILVYDPVCGCDGNTYSNSCFAYINGVTSWTSGACGGNGGGTVVIK